MADQTAQANTNTPTDGGQQSAPSQAQPTIEQKFTQADIDRIIAERIGRVKAQYADYDELKAKADAMDSANKSEIEKAAERAAKAEARLKEVEATARARELNATAKEAAAELGFEPKKLDKVIRLIDLTTEMDAPAIRQALETLAKDMPELLNKRPPITGTSNPAKNDAATETDKQRRERLFGARGSLDFFSNGNSIYHPEAE